MQPPPPKCDTANSTVPFGMDLESVMIYLTDHVHDHYLSREVGGLAETDAASYAQ